ncbi:MAG TPA: GatB/YqeY domain-containing protein [Anaerolineales bacterium]|nr:GatB/YqeY domain-containing protein [Anaerolineales bacterium]
MDTKSELQNALKEALRAGEETRKATIRMALAAIRNAEIERRAELDESELQAILQKEVKSRRETLEEAQVADRQDLVEQAESEIAILEKYLPQPLTRQEIISMARTAIEEVGASSPREMGQVMKVLMPRVRGRADGSEVSQIVQEMLG